MIVSFPIRDDTLPSRIIAHMGRRRMVSGLMPTFIVNFKSLRDVSRSAVYRYNTPHSTYFFCCSPTPSVMVPHQCSIDLYSNPCLMTVLYCTVPIEKILVACLSCHGLCLYVDCLDSIMGIRIKGKAYYCSLRKITVLSALFSRRLR